MKTLNNYIQNISLSHISNEVKRYINIRNIFDNLHITT